MNLTPLSALAMGAIFLSASSFAGQYPDEAKSTRTSVVVTVVWGTPTETDAICAHLSGEKAEGNIYGCFDPRTFTIYTPEPTSFNDHWRLLILGHEFWHALGASHP